MADSIMKNAASAKVLRESEKVFRELVKRSKERPMTPEERHQQKVSFIMGTMGKNSKLSREDIERILKN